MEGVDPPAVEEDGVVWVCGIAAATPRLRRNRLTLCCAALASAAASDLSTLASASRIFASCSLLSYSVPVKDSNTALISVSNFEIRIASFPSASEIVPNRSNELSPMDRGPVSIPQNMVF